MPYQSEFHNKAITLFERFADRHELIYNVEAELEVDVLWTFPVQSKLALPVTLCLRGDELNFGVEKFWSYYFPFEQAAERFDQTLNMWIKGDARIAIVGKTGRLLQVSEGSSWRTIYRCGGFFCAGASRVDT
jgi:hypothetical protein